MKWLLKWILRLGLVLAVVIVLLFLFKDAILRSLAEHRIHSQTGMKVSIGKFSGSFTSPVVTIQDFKLYNTADFGGGPFVTIPELHLECDPLALARGRLRINLLRLNLAEVVIVRNQAGQTNVVNLLAQAGDKTTGHNGGKGKEPMTFEGIDVLNLSLGSAKYIDLRDPRKNRNVSVDVKDMTFRNVKSESDVNGVLAMIWLQSGGKFGVTPVDFTKSYLNEKLDDATKAIRKQTTNP